MNVYAIIVTVIAVIEGYILYRTLKSDPINEQLAEELEETQQEAKQARKIIKDVSKTIKKVNSAPFSDPDDAISAIERATANFPGQ